MRVLIVKPSSLGDVVHGLRVIAQAKGIGPDLNVDWVIKRGLAGILDASNIINKIFFYDRGKGFFRYANLAAKIRRRNYDFILDMQGLIRSAFLVKLAKGGRKLGRADGREFSTLFYDSIGEKDRSIRIHAIDRMLPFLTALGISGFDESLPLQFSGSSLNAKLKKLLLGKKNVLLFPESRRKEKVWPFFKDLVKMLSSDRRFRVVVAGAESQQNEFSESLDLRGKLSLNELPALVGHADLVVSNDSAPLHVASAMGRPSVSLFGPTDPVLYGPYPADSDDSVVLHAPSRKIEDLKINTVYRAVAEKLGQANA